MSDKSTIEWLNGGSTWNATRGCTPCAPECARCYARTFAERWRGIPGHPYEQGFDPRLVPDALDLPLRWRKPRTIFVNSMSDLFHDAVPDTYIEAVFGVMSLASHHSYILLTKRAARMRAWLAGATLARCQAEAAVRGIEIRSPAGRRDRARGPFINGPWPLPNVMGGVSVGTRDRRIDIAELQASDLAMRMVSFEPLLEEMGDVDLRGIDLAAIGGESGPGARPCNLAWIRSLVKRCRIFGTHAFVKQLGARSVVSPPQGQCPTPGIRDRKGGDPAEWPADLRVRELPEVTR